MSPIADPDCPTLPEKPTVLSVRFPGGLKMSSLPPLDANILTEIGAVQSLLTQLAPALAALQPIFTIINAVTTVFDVIKAFPSFAVQPQEFFDKLKKATVALSELASLYPPVAVPLTIRDSIQILLASMQALKSQVSALLEMSAEADALIQQAQSIGDVKLEAVGNCKKQLAESFGEHAGAALGPLGQLMDVMRALMDLTPAGGDQLPSASDASGESLEALDELLDTLIEALEAVNI